jgi:hypothetical protein
MTRANRLSPSARCPIARAPPERAGNDREGHGVVVFDTEEHAKAGLQEIGFEIGGAKVTSSEVYRLHGEA